MSSNNSRAVVDNFPLAKKLRSSEPDLKVVLGGGCDQKQTTRWYHSQMLASKSKYIDTMLAVPMKESKEMAISFPDIPVEIWDGMIKFLDNPIAIQNMTANDVMKVAKHYDKYEFSDGKVLCDHMLVKRFKATQEEEKTGDLNIDEIVDAVVVASEANLDSAWEEGISYIGRKIRSVEDPYGRTMFTKSHMRKLAPLLSAAQSTCTEIACSSWSGEFDKSDFPQRFVELNRQWLDRYTLHTALLSHIELSGTRCKADGDFHTCHFASLTYECNRVVNWSGNQFNVAIERNEDGWAIVYKTLPTIDEEGEPDYESIVETTRWNAPCTQNHSLPPRQGWKAVDPLARGNPTIRYVCQDDKS